MLKSSEKNVDVVVVGTGLTNCLVAAALARSGEDVIHFDTQANYGDTWQSLSLLELENWAQSESQQTPEDENSATDPIPDGLTAVALEQRVSPYTDRSFTWYPFGQAVSQASELAPQASESVPQVSESAPQAPESVPQESESAPQVSELAPQASESVPQESELAPQASESSSESVPQASESAPQASESSQPRRDLRHVTVDMCPKLLFSKSEFIDVCIESSVSRYLEFQGLKTPLTVFTDQFSKIPTSKSAIFQSKELSLPEKRLLMKFITSVSKSFAFQTPATLGRDTCEAKIRPQDDDLDGTWADWLGMQELTPRLRDFITYGICLAQEELSSTEGLRRLQQFTESLMIYGQSCPLLYPMHGTGDLPQAFTRVAALHQGVYALRTKLTHVLKDDQGSVKGVRTHRGEVIQCKRLVIPPGHFARAEVCGPIMLRLVALTSRRLLPEDGLGLSVTLPTDSLSSAQILQLDHTCGTCPLGLYLYHLCVVADHPDHSGLHELLERLLGEEKTSCIAMCSYVHRTVSAVTDVCEGAVVTSETQPLPGFTLHADVLREAQGVVSGEFLKKPEYVAREEAAQRYDALEQLSANLARLDSQ